MDTEKASDSDRAPRTHDADVGVISTEYEYYCQLKENFSDERLTKLIRKIEYVKICLRWKHMLICLVIASCRR